jgi:hypothetical protein
VPHVPRRRTEIIEFAFGNTAAVVRAMDDLAAAHDGWINVQPAVRPEDEPPPRSGLSTLLLAGAVHDVPLATWVPGKRTSKGDQPDSVGVQHAAGARVVPRLEAVHAGLPEGWQLAQDHPRRGLVVSPSVGADHDEVLAWILEAASVLSTVRLSGDWLAEVHMPR